MAQFESVLRHTLIVTRPCRMQRQRNEDSFGFMGPGIGPPRLRASSALAKDLLAGLFRSETRRLELGAAVGSNLAEPRHPLSSISDLGPHLILRLVERRGGWGPTLHGAPHGD